MFGTIMSGVGSIAGGLLSGAGGLFGGKGGQSGVQKQAKDLAFQQLLLQKDAVNTYNRLYNKYYWPIEEFIAGNYYDDIREARPYQMKMRDYQLNRGDELIDLAEDTNPILDEDRKSLIRRLTEGEDVLANRYRSQASADITSAFNNQRNQDFRNMASMGINPNSGAWANYGTTMGQNEALAQAAGRTNATWQAEDTSLQRQADAQNYYTNPSMLYDAGTITPGMSIGSLTSGASQNMSLGLSGQNRGNGNLWSSLGSAVGGITQGIGNIGGALGWGEPKFTWDDFENTFYK
jgi:hypothetical protein